MWQEPSTQGGDARGGACGLWDGSVHVACAAWVQHHPALSFRNPPSHHASRRTPCVPDACMARAARHCHPCVRCACCGMGHDAHRIMQQPAMQAADRRFVVLLTVLRGDPDGGGAKDATTPAACALGSRRLQRAAAPQQCVFDGHGRCVLGLLQRPGRPQSCSETGGRWGHQRAAPEPSLMAAPVGHAWSSWGIDRH